MKQASATLVGAPGARLGPEEWRRLMAHWPSGVAVVTTEGGAGPRGCTANAVTSLSLDPLLLLVCFARDSYTLAAVRQTGRFCLNVLAADQEPVARRFAVKCDDDSKFTDVAYELVDGLPVLSGTVAWIACEIREELPGGDHVIVLAEPRAGAANPALEPLVFHRSAYL